MQVPLCARQPRIIRVTASDVIAIVREDMPMCLFVFDSFKCFTSDFVFLISWSVFSKISLDSSRLVLLGILVFSI